MKAFVYKKYGGPEVLTLEERKTPSPKENEVLIRVKAISLNPAEWHLMTASFWMVKLSTGLSKPKNPILGGDISGEVIALGPKVTDFKIGDRITGRAKSGAFAEKCCLNLKNAAKIPNDIDYDSAAALPLAGTTALTALLKGNIKRREHVLINGASGGIGTYAVQLAKHFEAHVTGVCGTSNQELVRSLGADSVIDYSIMDFTQGNQQYDLIIDLIGNRTVKELSQALSTEGRCVLVGMDTPKRLFSNIFNGKIKSLFSKKKIDVIDADTVQKDLVFLLDLMVEKKIVSIIHKTYDFESIPKAFEQLGSRRSKGKLIVSLD